MVLLDVTRIVRCRTMRRHAAFFQGVRMELIIDRICVVIPANLDQEKTLERTSEDNPTRWTVAA